MTKKRSAWSRGGAAPPPAAGGSEEFARLLAETGRERFAVLSAGDRVEGTVVQRTASALLIDVGQRSEAVMPLEGMTPEELVALRVGTRAQFLVTRAAGGTIELSHALAARALDLERLQEARRSGVPVEGKVSGENKGGFTVELGGQRGFVPFSQMELGPARPFAEYAGRTLRFQVSEVRGRDVVLSRIELLREEQAAARAELLAGLDEGQILEATVVRAERFGVFVDLGAGVHALVPRSELSWSRDDTARPALPPGTAVTVRLLEVDLEGERPRISASLKQVGEDPWREAAALLAPGRTLKGRVTRVAVFGAFVELTPGVEGLVHVSAMGGGRRVTHPSEVVRPGQEVEVAVLAIDPEARRISLSLDPLEAGGLDEVQRAKLAAPEPAGGGGGALADALQRALAAKPGKGIGRSD
jgi:small subunit ribosomal protein S1